MINQNVKFLLVLLPRRQRRILGVEIPKNKFAPRVYGPKVLLAGKSLFGSIRH
jgi:hypothetical protein